MGSLTSHRFITCSRTCETGPTVYRPYPPLFFGRKSQERLEKTRKSNRLQMLIQRQQFVLSYLKTLSIGPAGVWTYSLPLSRPALVPSGWFSNRTGTSVDDGERKLSNWLDQWQKSKLGTGSRVYSFPRDFPSSTDVHVLLLNQPIELTGRRCYVALLPARAN